MFKFNRTVPENLINILVRFEYNIEALIKAISMLFLFFNNPYTVTIFLQRTSVIYHKSQTYTWNMNSVQHTMCKEKLFLVFRDSQKTIPSQV